MQDGNVIRWRLRFASDVADVYRALDSDVGRSKFWAESAIENNGVVTFTILNYPDYQAQILERIPYEKFRLDYFGTDTTFILEPISGGGTDLSLVACVEGAERRSEMRSGWVSVLLAMKAYVDFGVDLRNHDKQYAWKDAYVDN